MSYAKKPRKEFRQSLLGFIPGQKLQRQRRRFPQRPTRFSPEHLEHVFNKRLDERRIVQFPFSAEKTSKTPPTVGSLAGGTVISYNSHGVWSTLGEIRELEKGDRGNTFPDLNYPDDTPAIWVCLSGRKALRYSLAADQWDRLDSNSPLTPEDRENMKALVKIPLKMSDVVAAADGDDGFLILRPKG